MEAGGLIDGFPDTILYDCIVYINLMRHHEVMDKSTIYFKLKTVHKFEQLKLVPIGILRILIEIKSKGSNILFLYSIVCSNCGNCVACK